MVPSIPLCLIEASPYDTIWGIGFSGDQPQSLHPEQWRGTNREAAMQSVNEDEYKDEYKDMYPA